MQFPKETLKALAFEEATDGYEVLENDIIDTTEWSCCYSLIFSFEGKYYESGYQIGATEYQDERPYDCDDEFIECQEVEPVEITTTTYTPISN